MNQLKIMALLALFGGMLGGCTLSFDASDKSFKCASNDDCSTGFKCSNPIPPDNMRVCVDENKLSAPLPDTGGADVGGQTDLGGTEDATQADLSEQDLPPADLSIEDTLLDSGVDQSIEDTAADIQVDSGPPDLGADLPPDQPDPVDIVVSVDSGIVDAGTPDQIVQVDAVQVDSTPAPDVQVSECEKKIDCIPHPSCIFVNLELLKGSWKVATDSVKMSLLGSSTVCANRNEDDYRYGLDLNGTVVIGSNEGTGDDKTQPIVVKLNQLNYCLSGPDSGNIQATNPIDLVGNLMFGPTFSIVPNGMSPVKLACLEFQPSPKRITIKIQLNQLLESNPGVEPALFPAYLIEFDLVPAD